MARYTGPKTKIGRRYGVPLFGPSKSLERKNYPPGCTGRKGPAASNPITQSRSVKNKSSVTNTV